MLETPESPSHRYQRDLAAGFIPDPAQAAAIERLQSLYLRLTDPVRPGPLWSLFKRRPQPVTGLYLWGGVGRGKTYLMDCFYESLPLRRKRRVHFHRFMEGVHDRLERHRDQRDPLEQVGRELAGEFQVLCFDEFFVSDIGDAMILAQLLRILFQQGTVLVATSNVAPDDLYRDGLQRAKFLPAIDLIKQHTEVLRVDGGIDYRLRILETAEIYHWPLDRDADDSLERSFSQLAPGQVRRDTDIRINHRSVRARALGEGVGWFSFAELCQTARSPSDYIELARRFNTVLLSDVPAMADEENDAARRFIHLVDELYDRQVNLIVSAEVERKQLYSGQRLAFEFRRTVSRLIEMQTHEYLAKEHRP
ncbi:MAG: cell division protein ZapE [Xanthomonadales bacterium]|nr:cell division protein ZapE [Xanthomonadales bacterium]